MVKKSAKSPTAKSAKKKASPKKAVAPKKAASPKKGSHTNELRSAAAASAARRLNK